MNGTKKSCQKTHGKSNLPGCFKVKHTHKHTRSHHAMYSHVASPRAVLAASGGSAACQPSGLGGIYSATLTHLSKNH